MAESQLELLTDADLPLRLGRYEVQSVLGQGGMARVFRAELLGPAGFRKQVAVKVIKADVLDERESNHTESFIREARLGGLLKHPNIVDVYEFGDVKGQLFIVMELVEGQTLAQLIRTGERLPASVVLEIAAAITAGLGSAHSLNAPGLTAGLVHRDMKPSNVLLSWTGAVKVADFGIATTHRGELAGLPERAGRVVGTLSYMSPEQMRGEALDGRSDLFSLGLVLLELAMAKRLPRHYLAQRFTRDGGARAPVVDADYLTSAEEAVPGLSAILLRCLAPTPEARYSTAEELLSDIELLRQQVGSFPRLRTWLLSARASVSPDGGRAAGVQPVPDPASESVTVLDSKANSRVRPRVLTNLGAPVDSFVGRETELVRLRDSFEQGARLVTVKGMGGTGKTRFARRYARSQVEALDGGAWFVDLTEARTPNGLVQATAMALNVPLGGEEIEGLVEQLGHAIAGRGPVLLVLDNFEQVAQHAEEMLPRWLKMAPSARFLVTSRESLRIAGEQIFELDPLPPAEGVALFELRARAAGASWQETDETRNAIAGIVRGVDGLPLAIELAAARASLLGPSQLLERLSKRFDLLRRGRRGATSRQSSILGLIDWSWEMLEPWEQVALAQLSVFRDGFFIEAAEAVLDLSGSKGAPWSMDVVGSLLDKSLLRSRQVHGQPRFGMYVSIQEYAAQKLGEATERTALRHAQYFASFGTTAFQESLKSHGGGGRARLLALEFENLMAAVATSLDAGKPEAAAGSALALAPLFKMHGPLVDGVALIERVRARVVVRGTQGRLAQALGLSLNLLGRSTQTLEQFEQALAIARESGDRWAEGMALGGLAWLRLGRGLGEGLLEQYQEALLITREVGNRSNEGSLLTGLGWFHAGQGRLTLALEHCEQALALHRELGNLRGEGITLGTLATILRDQGQSEEALLALHQALSIHREAGNRRLEGSVLGSLAHTYQSEGRAPEALDYYHQALTLVREVGDRFHGGVTLGNLGDLLFSEGDLGASEQCLSEAIEMVSDTFPPAGGAFRGTLALIRAEEGDLDAARLLLTEAESQLRGVQQTELGKLLCKKARVECLTGDLDVAEAALEEAEAIAGELNLGAGSELREAIRAARAGVSRVSGDW